VGFKEKSSNRFLSLAIIVIAFSIFSGVHIYSMQPGQGDNVARISPEEQAAFGAFNHDYDQFRAGLDQQRQDLTVLMDEFQRQCNQEEAFDMGPFAGFKKKIFLESSKIGGAPLTVGFSGEDVFRIVFLVMQYVIDRILYEQLKKYHGQILIQNIMKNKDKLIYNLHALKRNSKGKLVKNAKVGALKKFLTQEIFTVSRKSFAKQVVSTVKYLLLCEGTKGLEQWVFPPESWVRWFFSKTPPGKEIRRGLRSLRYEIRGNAPPNFRNDDEEEKFVISGFSILKFCMACFWGYAPAVDSLVPSVRDTLLGIAGFDHKFFKFFRTYWFYLLKRSLVLLRFVHQNNNFYHDMCEKYFVKNSDQLLRIMQGFPDDTISEDKKSVEFKEAQNKARMALKMFVGNAHESLFVWWWRFEQQCFAWTDIMIESVVLLPVWYKGAKYLYQNYVH